MLKIQPCGELPTPLVDGQTSWVYPSNPVYNLLCNCQHGCGNGQWTWTWTQHGHGYGHEYGHYDSPTYD
jgi:hypothetical protein